ncbi:hypothetical protein GCM10010499_38440 [Streptomyces thermoviolaceus subsp. apingens]|nr:hypothetical protein GCM10010499_38440 [Streptomyces thermoviolaceus subsp. apingens]
MFQSMALPLLWLWWLTSTPLTAYEEGEAASAGSTVMPAKIIPPLATTALAQPAVFFFLLVQFTSLPLVGPPGHPAQGPLSGDWLRSVRRGPCGSEEEDDRPAVPALESR